MEGKKGQSFSLLQSQRVDGNPRHFTLLNLCPDFSIPIEDWGELTQCVVSRLKEKYIHSHKEYDEDSQKALYIIVKRLQDKGYDVYAKPPNSRDKILTKRSAIRSPAPLPGSGWHWKPLSKSGSRRFFGI